MTHKMTEETAAAVRALAAKLDSIEQKLDLLIAGRKGQQEPRPTTSKRRDRRLHREHEWEAFQARMTSNLAFVWSRFSPAITMVAELVYILLTAGLMSGGVLIIGRVVLPKLIFFIWSLQETNDLLVNMAEMLARLARTTARNATGDPGL